MMQTEVVAQLQQWLITLKPTHFVTFNFNAHTTLVSGRKALKRFQLKLDRKLYGRDFNKRPAQQRTLFVAFPEHVANNLHYHAIVCTDAKEFARVATETWAKVVPSGSFFNSTPKAQKTGKSDVDEATPQPITESHAASISSYVTKEAKVQYDYFVVSSEFVPTSA